jgi:hypothetical protein
MKLFKKLSIGFVALAASASVALAANIPLISGPQDSSQLIASLNQVIQAVNSGVVGKLYANGVTVGTGADTTEDTLYTYTLPANTLANTGDMLRIRCGTTSPATATNKTVKLYFGASSFSTGAVAVNPGSFNTELIVIRTGAATQAVWGSGSGGDDGTQVVLLATYTAGTDDLTTALTIKCTGTNGTANANDISGRFMSVELVK